MKLVEWLQYLGTAAAWGVLSSIITQAIKKLWPNIVDHVALAISGIVAVAVGLIANALIPWATQLPPLVSTAIVWIASLAWYEFLKWLGQRNGQSKG